MKELNSHYVVRSHVSYPLNEQSILADPLRFELRSHGFGDRDNNHYTKDLYVHIDGLEPPTSALTVRYSYQLS